MRPQSIEFGLEGAEVIFEALDVMLENLVLEVGLDKELEVGDASAEPCRGERTLSCCGFSETGLATAAEDKSNLVARLFFLAMMNLEFVLADAENIGGMFLKVEEEISENKQMRQN